MSAIILYRSEGLLKVQVAGPSFPELATDAAERLAFYGKTGAVMEGSSNRSQGLFASSLLF